MTTTAIDLTAYDAKKFNVLVPTATIQQISPWHQLRVEQVSINPDPEAGEVFKVGSVNRNGQWEPSLALSKVALLKLAMAAGITWSWVETKVLSASRDYVLCQAVGAIRKPSGEWIPLKATKEIDLAVIEEEVREAKTKAANETKPPRDAAWIEQQVISAMIQWRKNKLMRAETGAMLRVIRALLTLRGTYTPSELTRPFIVPRVDFAPDPHDPEARRIMLAQGSRSITDLFAGRAAEIPAALEAHDEPDYEAPALLPGDDLADLADDEPEEPIEVEAKVEPVAAPAPAAPAGDAKELFPDAEPSESDIPPCSVCGKAITEKVYTYSLRRFGAPLCYNCQKQAGAK